MKFVKAFPARRRHRHHFFAPNFNRFFEDFAKTEFPTHPSARFRNRPAVNILETEDDFRIELAVPGLSKDDISINVDKDVLTIKAEKELKENLGEKYTRREFGFSNFKRAFRLPETIDTEGISADFNHGILLVTLAKKEEAKPQPVRKIEIS